MQILHKYKISAFTAAILMSTTAMSDVHAQEIDASSVLNMSLAELTNVQVTSVSKKAEKASEAAAAIYVITQEDIRRSGATAIPDLLRMAPGITVTQSSAHEWTVTSRGFNAQFSNKLLVLMDGRTIYSPLFSGVIWDVQDTMLEDIERIEVIRGPGATVWGANAVNGVINIITKNAKDTQGGLASFTAGNQVKGIGSVRYGGKLAENSYIRAYAKQSAYNSNNIASGASANDNWNKSQAGFRSDSNITDNDKLNVQGDVYTIDEDANYIIPDLTNAPTYANTAEGTKAKGVNILASWEHKHNEDSLSTAQFYIDQTDYKTSFFNDSTTTFDLDLQNNWSGWSGHDIVWGVGYRLVLSENDPQSAQYALNPKQRSDNLFNAFMQDEITLVDKELFLTLGSKFEHNDYTGIEIQPSARLSWLVSDNQTLWASVSRAVHTPYRFTDDAQLTYTIIPPGPAPAPVLPTAVQSSYNQSLDSEELIAYELGYRTNPTANSSIDIAAFYNDYDKLFRDTVGAGYGPIFPGPYAVLPLYTLNTNKASSYGLEVAGKWRPIKSAKWELGATYSYINLTFYDKFTGIGSSSFQGQNPKHQFNVNSVYGITDDITMTNALYYVDNLHGLGIDDYYRFDTRLAYQMTKDIELSVVGQNLLDSGHQEYTSFLYRSSASEIGRSIYANVAFSF